MPGRASQTTARAYPRSVPVRVLFSLLPVAVVVALGACLDGAASIDVAQRPESIQTLDQMAVPGPFMAMIPMSHVSTYQQLLSSMDAAHWQLTLKTYESEPGFGGTLYMSDVDDGINANRGQVGSIYGLGAGRLDGPLAVRFQLPPDAVLNTRDPDPLGQILESMTWNSMFLHGDCASWTMADGTEGTVQPIVFDDSSWPPVIVCELPAIGEFTSLNLGLEFDWSERFQTNGAGVWGVGITNPQMPTITMTQDTDLAGSGWDVQVEPVRVSMLVDDEFVQLNSFPAFAAGALPQMPSTVIEPGDSLFVTLADRQVWLLMEPMKQALWVAAGLIAGIFPFAVRAAWRAMRGEPAPARNTIRGRPRLRRGPKQGTR